MYRDDEDRIGAAEQLAEHNPHGAAEAFSAIACDEAAVGSQSRECQIQISTVSLVIQHGPERLWDWRTVGASTFRHPDRRGAADETGLLSPTGALHGGLSRDCPAYGRHTVSAGPAAKAS